MLSDSEDDIPLSKKWKRAITKDKEAEEDRISALPNSLLLRILSFLTTKEVVRTCLLSKRWEFIWTEVSEVDLLDKSDDIGKIRNFVDWVGRMLAMCKDLNKFAVDFRYKECFASNVNFWVYFAIKSKVKDITLSCSYELPQMFYSYSSLTNLTVRYCVMAPRGIIAWGSLKSLSIVGVELLDCVMEKILSGCPVLKVLRLERCWRLKFLNIYSPNLTTLKIENHLGFSREKFPDISAPYIRVLSILNDDSGGQFRLRNVSSVVRANLEFQWLCTSDISTMNHIKQLFESLQSVQMLELGPNCIKFVSELEVKGWKLPLSAQQDLTLNVWRHAMSIPGILAMLRASPNLETLHIRGRWVSDEETMFILDDYEISLQNCDMDLVALHLKTVKITDFTEQDLAGKPMLTLIQILLMNAKVLKKMVISVQEDPFESPSSSTSTDSTKIAKKLLTFPRASPKAVVVLS